MFAINADDAAAQPHRPFFTAFSWSAGIASSSSANSFAPTVSGPSKFLKVFIV
jgi:hypothetical protein